MLYIKSGQLFLSKVLMTQTILPNDFLLFDGEPFISAAYEYILLRPLDESGLKSGIDYFSRGGGKLSYLVSLTLSAEAAKSNPGVAIAGLSRFQQRLLRLPYVGKAVEKRFENQAITHQLFTPDKDGEPIDIAAFNRAFPQHIKGVYEAKQFFVVHDAHFVLAVYAVILGIRPSVFAEKYWTRQLRNGFSRASVLRAVLNFAGRGRPVIKHLWVLSVPDFMIGLPIIGNLFAAIFYLPKMKRIRTYILSVENELYRKKMMQEL